MGMTLEEKAELLAGASHWRTVPAPDASIPQLVLSDGPHGLRKQEGKEDHLGIARSRPATCFPSASALACSFDRALVERVGEAIGEEARYQGIDVVLGPGVNIKRHPLCGRNFEYFSEDPLLSGELGSAMVRGIQSRGVAACVKHLAGNSQEHARLVSDSVIDERTLRELYLAPFERVVRKAAPWCVMTAYNKLNGIYCSEHQWLLRDVLRGEWGFDGLVMSDWGAMSSSVASVRAGLDLCMPGPRRDHACAVVDALRAGELDEQRVNESVERIAHLAQRTRDPVDGDDGCRAPSPLGKEAGEDDRAPADGPAVSGRDDIERGTGIASREEHLYRAHAELARAAAAQSAVLLKNDGVLPLSPSARIAVIGAFARAPRYQGSGSSRINTKLIDNIWYRMEQRGLCVAYADGYDPSMGDASEDQLRGAERLAAQADVTVVVAGLPERYESEGFDRKLMCMPRGMNALIERVCAVNARTVVVLQGGAPIELPWRDEPAAILLMYLSGCYGGAAAVDILTGEVNPSGKLAETWPARLEDTALGSTYPEMDREVMYREAGFVGYRYYDAVGVEPAYPFGFGLSYTQFEYGELEVEPCGGGFNVSFPLRNAGSRPGAEAVQLYIAPCGGVVPPPCAPQWLAAFEKVFLEPGEVRWVKLSLDGDAFRAWDVARHDWRVYAGAYEIRVAASSRDIRLTSIVNIEENGPFGELTGGIQDVPPVTATRDAPVVEEGLNIAPHQAIPDVYRHPYAGCFASEESTAAFRRLYADSLPQSAPLIPFSLNTTASEMGACWLGRRLLRLVEWAMAEPAERMDRYQRAMLKEMAEDMPLRQLITSGVPMESVEGLVAMLNGRYFLGFAAVLRGFLHREG